MKDWTCCFTGHRPEKLTQPEGVVKANLEKEILQAISNGFTVFISGMARGVDLWAAEIVLYLKSTGQPIQLICAVPYDGFEDRWPMDLKSLYRSILHKADRVEFVCTGYSRNCFQLRNKWMVDHSSLVIAVYNGGPGGTKNTINYALHNSVPVLRIS